jgi:PAT family acetyl-CoA transporter-like MFS transporter 1
MANRHNADLLIQRKTSSSQNSSFSSSKIVMSPTTTSTKIDTKVPQNTSNTKAAATATAVPPASPNAPNHLLARTTRLWEHRARVRVKLQQQNGDDSASDAWNYALLIALYTLQGIPIGLSASIPFLIQQKMKIIASAAAFTMTDSSAAAAAAVGGAAVVAANTITSAERLTYRANAIFALCSWPFSLKLLWAPIVDSCFVRSFGRRKSWFVPVQALAGMLMLLGSKFVERQLGLATTTPSSSTIISSSINVKGVTAYFFALYFLFATQDIAVDGYALTLLSKKNRGRGPVCNSIGQNIGYFISFVGFLALNDAESCESIWRPLFRLPSNPNAGLVTLGGFLQTMGIFTLVTTTLVAIFKKETATTVTSRDRKNGAVSYDRVVVSKIEDDASDRELDAAEIGLKETYHRLWAVCQLPSVRWLFLILLTYRLPTSLGDNVKLLKSVEYGLSKTTTAVRTIPLPTCMIFTKTHVL